MMKPGVGSYYRFKELFDKYSKEAGKEQYLIPYFIAAHPGTRDADMLELALWLKKNGFRADQVQAFLPSPMATATAMYHSAKNPLKKISRGSEEVVIPKGTKVRRLHKAFLRYHDPENWPLLREALKRMGRADLIGNGKQHLIPAYQPVGARAATSARPFRTQHTGLPKSGRAGGNTRRGRSLKRERNRLLASRRYVYSSRFLAACRRISSTIPLQEREERHRLPGRVCRMDKWIVHKFGGSSVADAACFRRVAEIVEASSNPREAIVLSACRGVTDSLLELVALAEQPHKEFGPAIRALKARHLDLAAELISKTAFESYKAQFERDCLDIAGMLQTVRLIRSSTYSMRDVIAGFGELWSTRLFAPFLRERARIKGDMLWIDAREVIIIEWGSLGPAVQWPVSEENLKKLVPPNFSGRLIVTGFVATTTKGKQTTLGRNGSDFSGSIFGALLDAVEIIIWTDVDGVLSADPRLVPNAQVIDQLSYNEAMELAYFGAKVIHPQTMEPAVARDIPIFIRNTFAPQKRGTLICANPVSALIVKGITSIDPVALVNLEGAGMIGVPGTAHRLFGVLRDSGISVILDLPGQLRAFDLFRDSRSAGGARGRSRAPRVRRRIARRPDSTRGRSARHEHSGSGRRRHGRLARGCRQGFQFAGRCRDQRAGYRARRFRAQHLGGGRRQSRRPGAARGACRLLSVPQYIVDRLDRPRHGGSRAAGANRDANRAACGT